jgi:2,4-dienoyl-CoA reductase-like NADH-dependent reductase (Old Yellow Enzyme family)
MKRFEKLLEPYHIGSVKTRNRLIKTGATTLYWDQDELHMNRTILAYFRHLGSFNSPAAL